MPPLRNHTHCQVAQNTQRMSQNLPKSTAITVHGQTAENKARKPSRVSKGSFTPNFSTPVCRSTPVRRHRTVREPLDSYSLPRTPSGALIMQSMLGQLIT